MFQQLGVTRREVLVSTVPFLALPPSGLGQCYARALPFRREVENNGGARFYAPLETARGPWLAGPTAVVDGQVLRLDLQRHSPEGTAILAPDRADRSEEHTSELQSPC